MKDRMGFFKKWQDTNWATTAAEMLIINFPNEFEYEQFYTRIITATHLGSSNSY